MKPLQSNPRLLWIEQLERLSKYRKDIIDKDLLMCWLSKWTRTGMYWALVIQLAQKYPRLNWNILTLAQIQMIR
jgi:hypothetical protein